MTVRVAEIAFDPRTVGSDAVYTYQVDREAQAGQVFLAPLGSRKLVGVALKVYETDEEGLGFPLKSLRKVEAPILDLVLPQALLDLASHVAYETLCELPTALQAAIPPHVKERIAGVWTLAKDASHVGLTVVQKEVVHVLTELGELTEKKGAELDPGMLKHLRALERKGIVQRAMRIPQETTKRKSADLLAITPDSDAVERFLREEAAKKPAQALALLQVQEGHGSAFRMGEIKAMAGVTESTIRALIGAGLLVQVSEDTSPVEHGHELNPYQRIAVNSICAAVRGHEAGRFLLFGVTGSGKTEVYLQAVSEALQAGRQALYLVPEIALASQAIAGLRARFGARVSVLHSELSPKERLLNWTRIRRGETPIVLGARSALFAPLDNLGLIILDEEHEGSYKQESAPRYHSKSLAMFLGERHSCPVVLGSATPSIESFQEAEAEKLTLISLPERARNQALPLVHLVDLAQNFRDGHPALLADPIPEKLRATVERGEQAILFLNRRAYAPSLLCRDCGERMSCPRCTVALSFHRQKGWMQCHQCGYHARPPDTCPSCQGTRMKPFGIGTEKVEEAVKELLPDAKVGRLDRDVTQRKGALEEVLAAFRAGELQVLVGTQMVAKGLDFPNVTLVVVVSADVSLNIPDFRASERTFQLLSQVAGRAGRGHLEGEVYIQTFSPDHLAVACAKEHAYVPFYEALRDERKESRYPPFTRMVNVLGSGAREGEVRESMMKLGDSLRKAGYEVLGPAPAPLARVQNRFRWHLLIRLAKEGGPSLQGLRDHLALANPEVLLSVDVDPYSLM